MTTRLHALLATLAFLAAGVGAAADRDGLWRIVESCLDSGAADYCTACPAPSVESGCAATGSCLATTEVWAINKDYVAIRDAKACGCPADFVHGLALPRERVTGVEDARRPEGLWQFAWSAAEVRIRDRTSIALIVNPRTWRTQDQLHIHILRLRNDARAHLAPKAGHLPLLASTWARAAEMASVASLGDNYGILVMLNPAGGGYLLHVDVTPLEHLYALAWCK